MIIIFSVPGARDIIKMDNVFVMLDYMKKKKIKLNELFEIDGQLYIATKPLNPSVETHYNNIIIFSLFKLN